MTNPTRTTPDFRSWLERTRPRVDEALRTAWRKHGAPEASAALGEAIELALLGGGKRVRPALCLLACAAEGGDETAAMPAALACEMIHAYSLVHDDLPCMDDDAWRRDQPTVHVVHGEATAVLAGDALQSLAFATLAAQEDAVRARDQARLLSAAAGVAGMVGGQQLDMEAEGAPARHEAVRAIHARKTGALFHAALGTGARAADADPARWTPYARAVGALFQATDDVLDATATTRDLGKTAGRDSDRGKPTLVAALGVDGARRAAEALAEEALAALRELQPRQRYDELEDLPRFLLERMR